MLITHIAAVYLYIGLFFWRAKYLWTNQDERFLLFSERSRNFSIALVTLLIITGVYLSLTYDYQESGIWFMLKLILLGVAVVIGNYAMFRFDKKLSIATLVILLYITALSFTKSISLIGNTM